MKCSNCHEDLDPGAVFCGNCGQPVQAQTQPQTPAPPTLPTPPSPTDASKHAHSSPIATNATTPAPQTPGGLTPTLATNAQNQTLPAYSMAAAAKPGSGKAIIALVLGILGLVGWLIPFVGLILAIVAFILGTMSLKSSHKGFAIAGIVLSIITLMLSIFSFVLNIKEVQKDQGSANSAVSQTKATDLQTVSTPCYNVKLPKNATVSTTATCDIKVTDTASDTIYVVKAISTVALTTSNLKPLAQKDYQYATSTDPKFVSKSESPSSFTNDPAYNFTYLYNNKYTGVISYVSHKSGSFNMFIIAKEVPESTVDLKNVESNWQWK